MLFLNLMLTIRASPSLALHIVVSSTTLLLCPAFSRYLVTYAFCAVLLTSNNVAILTLKLVTTRRATGGMTTVCTISALLLSPYWLVPIVLDFIVDVLNVALFHDIEIFCGDSI